jgi:cyclohexadieny/prephenate dehydrogenase
MGLSPFRSSAKVAVAGFLAPLEMVGRFMEDAQATPGAVRWGDVAYFEDVVERGQKIRRSLFELKRA